MFDRAIGIDPNFTFAIYNKGIVLHELGQYDEAIEYFDKVIGIDPNDTDAIHNKGNALGKLGQYDEAIEYFDKVIGIDPNDTATPKRANFNKRTDRLK